VNDGVNLDSVKEKREAPLFTLHGAPGRRGAHFGNPCSKAISQRLVTLRITGVFGLRTSSGILKTRLSSFQFLEYRTMEKIQESSTSETVLVFYKIIVEGHGLLFWKNNT
jgi:hypothetical protein